jgi:UDP-N-acetylglucosamine 2-epimerase (non-hydrolysing)
MIHVVLGTKAQLVKMAPILVRLRDRELPHRFIHTGQHRATIAEMLGEFGLREPDVVLHRGEDVVSLPQMAIWMARILARCVTAREKIFGADARGIALVHGDTFSTLLGALLGRTAGLRVGHVESGLRSFDLLHPFPEEITRLLTFRLSHTLYCPGPWALKNVANYKREKVDTGCNTLSDTLALALATERRRDHVPSGPFALVSLHRYENIFRRERFAALIEILEELAQNHPLLFILHPPTENQLRRFALYDRLADNPRIELGPRHTYFDFVSLLEAAEYIATDGGSVQEESSYLGVPCLLLREATERREGLGENAVLSRLDRDAIRGFAREPSRYRRPVALSRFSPSDRIIESALAYA